MKSKRLKQWQDAAARCHLTPEEIDMAKAVGIGPEALIKNIPSKSQRWKMPVRLWVRELYKKRFPFGHKGGDGNQAEPFSEASGESESGLDTPFDGEADETSEREDDLGAGDSFYDDGGSIEEDGRVTDHEIKEQNRGLEKKREALRRAAELVAEEFGKLDFVQKVVLFGSVSKPPFKELARFRRLRQAGVKVWHESKDVDLLVWVSDLSQLNALRVARGHAVNRHQLEAVEKSWPGVPHHQVDVFLIEDGTNRYRGNLCLFGTCPKHHEECNDAGCGAQPFLRIYEGFRFERMALFGEHNQLLFSRAPQTAAKNDPYDEVPF